MTFIEYYKQQFKDVKTVYLLAKKHKKWPVLRRQRRMCNCYDEVVKKYRRETGDPHAGVYGCYSFSLEEVPEMKAHHRFRRKDGVLTDRTVTECIVPTYCPFCGRKYEEK